MITKEALAAHLTPFQSLFAHFASAGKELYAVGGCVRDILMGTEPKDFDFTTNALPSETKEILRQHGMKAIAIGEEFGTIATLIKGKTYEITSFRVKESYKKASRHPKVVFGQSLAKDLERRDLSINAMALDAQGTLYDPFHGQEDIKRRILRVPHASYEKSKEIFTDDPLRILRLARFLGRLDFKVDEGAERAAKDLAQHILYVSCERWRTECEGLLLSAHAPKGLQWLRKMGVLPFIIPEWCCAADVAIRWVSVRPDEGQRAQQNMPVLWDQILATMHVLPPVPSLRWAWLFSHLGLKQAARADHALGASALGQRMADEIMQRLKFSNHERQHVLRLLTPLPQSLEQWPARALAKALGDSAREWIVLQNAKRHLVDAAHRGAAEKDLEAYVLALEPYVDNPERIALQWPKNLSAMLKTELGLQGKEIGQALHCLEEAIYHGALDEALPVQGFIDYVKAMHES